MILPTTPTFKGAPNTIQTREEITLLLDLGLHLKCTSDDFEIYKKNNEYIYFNGFSETKLNKAWDHLNTSYSTWKIIKRPLFKFYTSKEI